ncbi:MAG: sugar ABC transporter permease [Candidatus Symbiobacter sp.]|nr:sugar ABC transporter permease [Candidatus Symbiobacter sp.]
MPHPPTITEHDRMRRAYYWRQTLRAYLFLAPLLLVFTVFMLIPLAELFYLTFHQDGILGPAVFVGLDNWTRSFSDPLVLKSILNTFYYGVMAIPTVFIVAMILALSLKSIPRLGGTFRVLLYFPTLQPTLIIALVWNFMIHPDFGILNLISKYVGGPSINFLGEPGLAMPTIAMIEVWKGLGFWTLLFLSGLMALPVDLFHAAELDGARAVKRFFVLTLPLLKPTFHFSIIFATIVNLQLFDSVYALTDGGPVNATATVSWYIYRSLFSFGEIGYGATLSFVLVLVVLGLSMLQMIVMRTRSKGA